MEQPRFIKIIFIIIGVALVLFVIIFVTKTMREDKEFIEALQKEYPKVERSVSINGIIDSLESYKGVSLVKLKNGAGHRLRVSKNYYYEPPELVNFLELGDSIVKNSLSDTLYIFRDQKKPYFFILGKYVGEN